MTIDSIFDFIVKFGTPLTIVWGIVLYLLKCNRERCNKLRNKLSELQYCFQQLDTAIPEEAIAVLCQELSSKLFSMFDHDILLALFSVALPNSQLRRFEPVVNSVVRRNKDIQNMLKACNHVQFLLNEIKHVFPRYVSLLTSLSKFLIQYKKNKVSTSRILFILMSNGIANQMKYQLEEHGNSKLPKELFSNTTYRYLSDDSFQSNTAGETIRKDTAELASTLVMTLLAHYISFSNRKLLWISFKQRILQKCFWIKYTDNDNIEQLFAGIQTDFSIKDRTDINTQIGRLIQTRTSIPLPRTQP